MQGSRKPDLQAEVLARVSISVRHHIRIVDKMDTKRTQQDGRLL